MSFKVLVRDDDGELHVLHEINDRRITRIGLSTRNGEAAGARIDHDMTEVLLTFEWVQNDGRPTIQDVEALQHPTMTGDQVQERVDRLNELPSATNSGLNTMLEAQRREHEKLENTENADPTDVDQLDDSEELVDNGSVPLAEPEGDNDDDDGSESPSGSPQPNSDLPPTVDPAMGSGVDIVPGAETVPPSEVESADTADGTPDEFKLG